MIEKLNAPDLVAGIECITTHVIEKELETSRQEAVECITTHVIEK